MIRSPRIFKELTDAWHQGLRVPGFNNGAVGVGVRIVAVLEIETVGTAVLGVFGSIPQPATRCQCYETFFFFTDAQAT
jgi:hypothetical protein